MNPLTLCNFEGAQYLLFGPNVAPLVYYSHLATMIIALALGIYILARNRRALPNQILFVITLAFSTWVFLDSIFWATNRSDVVMFTWAMTVLVEPLVHIAGLYFLYVLVEKRDMPLLYKTVLFVLYLPLIVFAPTTLNLSGFDVSSCLSLEGPIAKYYSYGLEIFAMLSVLVYAASRIGSPAYRKQQREILTLATGIFLLLFAFSWGNIIGSFTDDWQIAQYGLFGMPIFIALLMYGIVQYKIFNIKLIGAVALVLALCALNFALLFVQHVEVFRSVAFATLVLSIGFGTMLIRSVNKEIRQREQIERLSEEKSEFMTFASHEIRNPITAMRGYASLIVDGTVDHASPEVKAVAAKILVEGDDVLGLISQYLNKSKLELGQISYNRVPFDLGAAVSAIADGYAPHAQQKGLQLVKRIDSAQKIMVVGDEGKVKEVVGNIIDNSLKYTKEGSITISVERSGASVRAVVADTGVGIPPETLPKLFKKFSRADAAKANLLGTGVGLYLAKTFIEGMGGKIWAESEGKGKGSRFIIEFPAVSTKQ